MPPLLPHPFWQNDGAPLPRGRAQLAMRARYDAQLPRDEFNNLTPARWRRAVATLAHARMISVDVTKPVAARVAAMRIVLAASGMLPPPERDWNEAKKAGMRRRMRERRGVAFQHPEAERRWLASPLGEWMDQHHAEAAELLGHRHIDWAKAAAAFGAHGLTDRSGQLPTAETAQETWRRVEQALGHPSRPRQTRATSQVAVAAAAALVAHQI